MKWSTSAPANIMLMGEHSVVYGQKALAAALNQRLTIEWVTRNDNRIVIDSSLGHHETCLDTLDCPTEFQWIFAVFTHFRSELKQGFSLTIRSDFGSTFGLGSSAAILTAMLGGIYHYLDKPFVFKDVYLTGLKIIHKIQGRGSGTDLAASVTGGLVLFDPRKQTVQKLEQTLPLHLFYCGYKTPTSEVLKYVSDAWHTHNDLLESLYSLMGKFTEQCFYALSDHRLDDVYFFINRYQGLMDTLGVNDQVMSQMVYQLRQTPGIKASKISGSGLGDCVLAIGHPDTGADCLPEYTRFPLEISTDGLIIT